MGGPNTCGMVNLEKNAEYDGEIKINIQSLEKAMNE